MRVKIFTSNIHKYGISRLEQKINMWFEQNSPMKIHHITQTDSSTYSSHNAPRHAVVENFTISIFYEEKDGHDKSVY